MFADILRNELNNLAGEFANKFKLTKIQTKTGVIIFKKDSQKNTHGNFLDISYKKINKNLKWKNRLNKPHPKFPKNSGVKELDSCNSSDALLMNIFCHPKIKTWKSIKNFFGLSEINIIEFGVEAKILKNGKEDKTEIDMRLNNNKIIEAKLTEKNFQLKKKNVVEKYDSFNKIFNIKYLPLHKGYYQNYQLIRNIIAASELNSDFYLLCDMRRPDLIRSFYLTVRCVRKQDLRNRCNIVFWQELTNGVGKKLKSFLKEKYGF